MPKTFSKKKAKKFWGGGCCIEAGKEIAKEIIKELKGWHKSQEGYYEKCRKKEGFECDVCDEIKRLETKFVKQ